MKTKKIKACVARDNIISLFNFIYPLDLDLPIEQYLKMQMRIINNFKCCSSTNAAYSLTLLNLLTLSYHIHSRQTHVYRLQIVS